MLHGSQTRQEAVLGRKGDVTGIHRRLQVLDQGIEIGVGDAKAPMRRNHGMSGVTAGAAGDHAELVFQLGADAIHIGFRENILDARIGEIIVHRRIH